MSGKDLGITALKADDFSEWYTQVVTKAQLADYSGAKGFMVLMPYGFSIWERIKEYFDKSIKAIGHRNAYFPLLIPERLLKKESEHFTGFTPEVFWVTQSGDTVIGERLAIRPTSETVINESYSKWVKSWRDLPILINVWNSVVRAEITSTRPFLRTTEFLWQEGHTVHETEREAREETRLILDLYERFVRDYLAVPVFTGEKSESERFPGAVQTLAIEAMVQDRRAIQAGTSHFLGQNFARASGIQFQNREGKQEFGWTTSWGVSARLVGTLVMTHGDDDGVVLPPRIAPTQIVILPVTPREEARAAVLEACDKLAEQLREARYVDLPIEVEIDRREIGGGAKNWEWIKKGVPLRVEIGPRDLEENSVELSRRDQAATAKESMQIDEFVA